MDFTVTINPFSVLKFICVAGWLLFAGLSASAMMFAYSDTEDRIFGWIIIALSVLSALVVYFS